MSLTNGNNGHLVVSRFLRKHGQALRQAMRTNDRRTLRQLAEVIGLERARVAIERR